MQPRNYLTELLSELEKKELSEGDMVRASRLVETVKSAICFQLPLDGKLIEGNEALLLSDLTLDGFVRPPFDTIAIEYDLTTRTNTIESVVVIVMHDEEENGVLCIPSSKLKGEKSWRIPAFSFFYPYKNFGVRKADGKWAHAVSCRTFLPDAVHDMANGKPTEEFLQRIYNEDALYLVRGYMYFCAASIAYNMTFTDLKPDAKLNKMRRARGKMPLFTYKVLTIGRKKRKSQYLGGTHASPRSHLRRGYFRTSQKGARHWVQPCMVKGETDGFVHKDYIVEGASK